MKTSRLATYVACERAPLAISALTQLTFSKSNLPAKQAITVGSSLCFNIKPAYLESFWSSKAYANKIQFLWCLHHCYLSLIHVNKLLVTPQPLSGILGTPAATEMNKRGFLVVKLLSISSVCRVKKLFPYHYFDGWAMDTRQVICSSAYLDYRSDS